MFELLASLLISTAHASEYQQCTTSSSCTIGEFLYNDDYSVSVGNSCELTIKNPDGTAFVTSATMTGRSDGWYSYDATLGTTTGLYTATICCTPSSGLMCLDKSFEVKSPPQAQLTAAEVWNYSTRSLSTFGSLVTDIWGSSTRTMTSFGTLVSNLIGTEESATGATASPPTLSTIVTEQNIQRELLEKLVNAPIISLSLDETYPIPDLETKLDQSKKQASILYDNITASQSRLMAIDAKWDRLSQEAIEQEITAISSLFHNSDSLTALTKSWETESIDSLNQGIADLRTNLATLLTSTGLSKQKIAPSSLYSSLQTLSDLESTLGDSTNSSSDDTVFGHLARVWERDTTLQSENQKIAAILDHLNGQGENIASREVGAIKSRLLTINQYPGGESLATPAKVSSDPKINLKNILFSLQGLISLNRRQLAMAKDDPVRGLWLEEGSIIFRAVITNPSSIIKQTVPLKFYLPREVKTEDIITLDPSLSTTYDSTEEALYASGSFELNPQETKIVFVEIEDIWQLAPEEIETLRSQASNLLRPLEKTAYFSQGTTLKSDIDVTLDKISLSTGKAVTPENKIRAYREAKLELSKVNTNMQRLQDLVAQSSGTGSIFGFVGGVQTVAVWGMILVIVAGFVFMSIYFKKIQPAQPPTIDHQPLTIHHAPSWQMPAIIALVVVVTAGSTILLTQAAKPKPAPVINQVIVSSPSPSPTPASSPRNDILIKNSKDVLGVEDPSHTLVVPVDSSVNIRNKPSSDADIIMSIKASQPIYIFKESGDWRQIGFTPSDSTKGYWVNSKFISPNN